MSKTQKVAVVVFLEIISFSIILFMSIIFLFGGFNLIRYEYKLVFLLLCVLGVSLAIVPIFILKYKALYIIAIYLCSCLLFVNLTKFTNCYLLEKYEKFSANEWINKPVVRQVMYKDLENNEKFFLYDKKQVINELGIPEEQNDKKYYYKTFPGYIVIEFDNNIVKRVYWEHPLD